MLRDTKCPVSRFKKKDLGSAEGTNQLLPVRILLVQGFIFTVI